MSHDLRGGFEAAAWGWVAHLRDGGTTPWLEWCEAPTRRVEGSPPASELPGAGQLELVRRLALRAGSTPEFADLAELVLERPGSGRGLAELPLLWLPEPALTGRRYGAPPTDPFHVPDTELTRLGVGAVAELLVRRMPAGGRPVRPAPESVDRSPYLLLGAPVTAASVAEALAVQPGRPGRPGRRGRLRRRPRGPALVFVPPLEQLLGEVWSRRVQTGSTTRWPAFVGVCAGHDRLPPAAAVAKTAKHWAAQIGAAGVHIVGPGANPWGVTGRLLGQPRIGSCQVAGRPTNLRVGAIETVRQVNEVLGIRLPADRLDEARAALVAGLAEAEGPAQQPLLRVPEAHERWVAARAARQIGSLRRGGYPVHGDLDRLGLVSGPATEPDPAQVLDTVLDAVLGLWATRDGGRWHQAHRTARREDRE